MIRGRSAASCMSSSPVVVWSGRRLATVRARPSTTALPDRRPRAYGPSPRPGRRLHRRGFAPGAVARVPDHPARRRLKAADDGDRQIVSILTAVLSDGREVVEAACQQALAENICSSDLGRRSGVSFANDDIIAVVAPFAKRSRRLGPRRVAEKEVKRDDCVIRSRLSHHGLSLPNASNRRGGAGLRHTSS